MKNMRLIINKCIHPQLGFVASLLFLLAIPSVGQSGHFVEAKEDFPREEKNLRKWDAPVIADLDQDGFVDLLLNDHGLGVRVCWNNNGRFAKPYDLIMGDLHGISVGDFNRDGLQEIIISRGGGSGSNARNSKIFQVNQQREFTALPDFDVPLALMRGRTVKFLDGDNDGDLDLLNFAFPDRMKKGKSENYIYKNDGNGQLVLASLLPPAKKDGQKTLITDWNNDGIFDLLLYGEGAVKAFQGKGNLTYEEVTESVLPFDIEEVTSIIEFDYDNDGDFDLFFTRGLGFEIGETFYDQEAQSMGFYTNRGQFNFDGIEVGNVLQLENYHTQWPYINQLYIGETGYDYEFPDELHSGKDIRLVNSNALGFPDQLNKEGIFIGYVGNQKWRIAGKTKSSLTGVVHGVKSWTDYNHPAGLTDILLENKDGRFEDVTQINNLFFKEHTTGAAVADFDNNGWSDLIVLRRGDLIHENESLVFLNSGEEGFEPLKRHHVISPELGAIGLGVQTLDYNQDGKMDVILGNERGKWHLFKNQMEEAQKANYVVVEVGNSPRDNATALGALVTMESCNQKQVKRVGTTGAMYSLGFNPFVHFGLGACGNSVKIKVVWTNGETAEQMITSNKENIVLIGKK